MNSYGNLYYASDAFDGCETAQTCGDVEKSQMEEIAKRFVIGPVVSTDFWEAGRSELDINRGPCEWWFLSTELITC